MLPVGPVGYGDSPYSARSAFAGNPLFVDLDAFGIEIAREPFPSDHGDYPAASAFRAKHLRIARAQLDERAR